MKISTFSTYKKAEIRKFLNPFQLKTQKSILLSLPGFDNITYGFCLQQCVTESVLGALVGVSAVIGTLFVETYQKPVIFSRQITISKSEFRIMCRNDELSSTMS